MSSLECTRKRIRHKQRSRKDFSGKWILASWRPTETAPFSTFMTNLNHASGWNTSLWSTWSLSPVFGSRNIQGCVLNVLIWAGRKNPKKSAQTSMTVTSPYQGRFSRFDVCVVHIVAFIIDPMHFHQPLCTVYELYKSSKLAFDRTKVHRWRIHCFVCW